MISLIKPADWYKVRALSRDTLEVREHPETVSHTKRLCFRVSAIIYNYTRFQAKFAWKRAFAASPFLLH